MDNQFKRRNNFNKKQNLYQPQIINQHQPNQIQSQTNSSNNIVTVIICIVIFLVLFYLIYVYGEKIYDYFNKSLKTFLNGDYYLINDEENNSAKIKCKSGCEKGKCVDKNGECKNDLDCNLCVDDENIFYSKVPPKDDLNEKRLKEIEEEDIIQNRKIKELENTISERNKQIDELNKYIEYLNRNKNRINKENVKIIHEESSIHHS